MSVRKVSAKLEVVLTALLALSPGCASRKAVGPRVAQGTEPARKAGEGSAATTLPASGQAARAFEDAVHFYEEQAQLRMVDWSAVEKKFKAVAQVYDLAEAYYNLGVAYERQRRGGEAGGAYREALRRKPTLRLAKENLAVLYQNAGKVADAVALYQDILRAYPEDAGARARLAGIYRDAGQHERAMALAREALARDPKNALALKVMMQSYFDRQIYGMARLVTLRAMGVDPKDPELPHTLGLILLQEGDEEAAVAQLKKAALLRDDFLPSRVLLAQIALRHQDYGAAEIQLRKLLQYEPKSSAAHLDLGVAYRGLSQIDKAIAEYEVATKVENGQPAAWYNLGLIFHKVKDDPEKAMEMYRKFVSSSRQNLPAEHPVFANIRECEQLVRAKVDAKDAEEKAKKEEAGKKVEKPKGAEGAPAAVPAPVPGPAGAASPAAVPAAKAVPASYAPAPAAGPGKSADEPD